MIGAGSTAVTSINPGESPGTLTIDGNMTFNNFSALNAEIGGAGGVGNKGVTYDLLNVTGSITLNAGTALNVSLINSYVPVLGDTFDIMDWAQVPSTSPAAAP